MITPNGVGELGRMNMTRDQWLIQHGKIALKSMEAVTPEPVVYILDSRWAIVRIGSIWRADEEFHIYVMDQVVEQARQIRREGKGLECAILTPMWVFVRDGNGIVPTDDHAIIKIAEKNFLRLLHASLGEGEARG